MRMDVSALGSVVEEKGGKVVWRYLLIIEHNVGRPDTSGGNSHLLDAAEVLRVPRHQHVFPRLYATDENIQTTVCTKQKIWRTKSNVPNRNSMSVGLSVRRVYQSKTVEVGIVTVAPSL